LLYSNKSISEVAAYLNYSSQPYFQTVFKKVTGTTPYEYMKNVI
ncbi:MAG: helix-turn-helix transcriptional regulator, partial [Clostridia bacterium]|nr:helix-turn-helix transcriptional regulator [Clostridia bacterium]